MYNIYTHFPRDFVKLHTNHKEASFFSLFITQLYNNYSYQYTNICTFLLIFVIFFPPPPRLRTRASVAALAVPPSPPGCDPFPPSTTVFRFPCPPRRCQRVL